MDIKINIKTTIVKTNYKSIQPVFVVVLAAISFLVACNKNNDLTDPTRLFRPVLKEQLMSEGNWVAASWQAIKGAQSYTIQLSRDTFKTVDATVSVDTSTVRFENLKWNQLYQVQVRANAKDTVLNSKMSFLGAVKTPKFPTILNTPTSNDATDEAIRVSWVNSGAAVTSIKVLKLSDSSLVKEVAITSQDIARGNKVITGLAAATTYVVYLYSGTTVRGWDNYTTKAALAGNIVDLRGITDRPSVLADTLPVIPAGSTVILKRGQTYVISSSINLNKAVTIMGGTDLSVPDQAIINLPANFNIAAGSNIEYVDFKDVYLQGTDAASKYVFNVNNACTVGRISFESCKAEFFRGVVRLQNQAITVSDFTVNNSIIDSIGGYGVLTVDGTNCKANNITLTNSTVYKAEVIIVSRNNANTVTIENCTFNEAPRAGNYLINFSTSGTNNVTSGIKIANNIFGIGKSNAGATAVRGVQVGSGSVDASNNYSTADYSATSNQIPNLNSYSRKSTELFQDPANGNFKIVDNGYPGRSNTGDPRWRP